MTYKCEKCRDTGVWETGNNDLPCDCPAGKTALFNVAGFAGPVRGADLDRLDRSQYCRLHQQYSCVVCTNSRAEKEAWDSFQKELGDWCDKTFPNSTPKTILAHFKDEAKELLDASDAETDQEIADCIMLLLHLAHKRGVSARDAIREKFEVCKKRKWGPPDDRGVVRHVAE